MSVGEKWMHDKRTPKDVCGEAITPCRLRTMTLKVKELSIIISKDVYVPEKGPFWIEDQAHPNLLVHIYQNNNKETRC